VYKRHLHKNSKNIIINNQFRQQLSRFQECDNISQKNILKVNYLTNDLINLFITYNNCYILDPEKHQKTQKDKPLHIKVNPGIRHSTFDVEFHDYFIEDNYGDDVSISLGIELELFLKPKKLAVYLNPTYQSFESQKTIVHPVSHHDFDAYIKFKTLEFPLGIRQYFNINENTQFFAQASYALDVPFDFEMSFNYIVLESKLDFSPSLGVGLRNSDKYTFTIEYCLGKDMVRAIMSTNYRYLSATLGYTIF